MKLVVRILPMLAIAGAIAVVAHRVLDHFRIEGELVDWAVMFAAALLAAISDRDLFYGTGIARGAAERRDGSGK